MQNWDRKFVRLYFVYFHSLRLYSCTSAISSVLNSKHIDWDKYNQFCSSLLHTRCNDDEVDIELFAAALVKITNTCTPSSSVEYRQRKSVSWWNQDCILALRNRRKALRTLKTNPTNENFIAFRKMRDKAAFIFKEVKRKSWR